MCPNSFYSIIKNIFWLKHSIEYALYIWRCDIKGSTGLTFLLSKGNLKVCANNADHVIQIVTICLSWNLHCLPVRHSILPKFRFDENGAVQFSKWKNRLCKIRQLYLYSFSFLRWLGYFKLSPVKFIQHVKSQNAIWTILDVVSVFNREVL